MGYFLDVFFTFNFQKMWIEKFPYYTYCLSKKLRMSEVWSWQSLWEEKDITLQQSAVLDRKKLSFNRNISWNVSFLTVLNCDCMQFVIILSLPLGLFCFPWKLCPKQVAINQPNQVYRRSNTIMIVEYLPSLMHKMSLVRSSPSYHKVSFSTAWTLQIWLFFILIYD